MNSVYQKLSSFYNLTKPGITRMVVLTTSTGYYLAIPESSLEYFSVLSHFYRLFLAIAGSTLICAGSCVLNNYIERDIDKLMKRTMNRALPSGNISAGSGLLYGIVLSVFGAVCLFFVNYLTLLIAIATWVSYVVIYTPLKRKSVLSLFVGAIPGALPMLGGWTAYKNSIEAPAIVLFGIMFIWQLPHFLSLSWMYKKDYERGGFIMTVVVDDSGKRVSTETLIYCLLLLPVSLALWQIGVVGIVYAIGAIVLNLIFIGFALKFRLDRTHDNARATLLSSYFFLTGLIILMFLNKL
ncbi:MAG: protoheme IX farnesyltransferase [Bacteroidetes bacterium]|nr:protoheme IX farnesyltransferase [Bacteroidota bacterium]